MTNHPTKPDLWAREEARERADFHVANLLQAIADVAIWRHRTGRLDLHTGIDIADGYIWGSVLLGHPIAHQGHQVVVDRLDEDTRTAWIRHLDSDDLTRIPVSFDALTPPSGPWPQRDD